MKELVGKQHNLNEGLKAAIKAAPGKMMQKSPMNMKEETAMKMGMVSPMKIAGMDDPERARLMASLNAAKVKNPELYSDKNRKVMEKAGKKQPKITSAPGSSTSKKESKFKAPNFSASPSPDSKLARDIMQETGRDTGFRGEMKEVKPVKRKQEKLVSVKAKKADVTAGIEKPKLRKNIAPETAGEIAARAKAEKDQRKAQRKAGRRSKFKQFAKGFREGFVSQMTGDKVADIRKRTEERKAKRKEEKKEGGLIAAASRAKG